MKKQRTRMTVEPAIITFPNRVWMPTERGWVSRERLPLDRAEAIRVAHSLGAIPRFSGDRHD